MINDVQKTFFTGEFAKLFDVKKIRFCIMIKSIYLSRLVCIKMGTVTIHLSNLTILLRFNPCELFNFRSKS